MITATDLEVRAGARTLLSADGPALRVQPGDRIGLVGRNGAGKTTTMRILAGEGEPYAGTIVRTGEVGYLPQDPREGNLDTLARDRVLSARGLAFRGRLVLLFLLALLPAFIVSLYTSFEHRNALQADAAAMTARLAATRPPCRRYARGPTRTNGRSASRIWS